MHYISITCQSRDASRLADALAAWFVANKTDASILCYGITPKRHEGFVVTLWPSTIPSQFREKLKQDSDILDYVEYDAINPPEPL